MSFKMAGALAFREAMAKAGPVAARADLAARGDGAGRRCRATSSATSTPGGAGSRAPTPSTAACRRSSPSCPTAEIQRYAVDLRSLTGGRGRFRASHDHYDVMPSNLVERMAKAKADGSSAGLRDQPVGHGRVRAVSQPRLERLGHDPHPGHRRHEVGVARPARQDVEVEVRGDPGPGGPAQVGADVDAVGRRRRRRWRAMAARVACPELGGLLGGELVELADVADRASRAGGRSRTGRR